MATSDQQVLQVVRLTTDNNVAKYPDILLSANSRVTAASYPTTVHGAKTTN